MLLALGALAKLLLFSEDFGSWDLEVNISLMKLNLLCTSAGKSTLSLIEKREYYPFLSL